MLSLLYDGEYSGEKGFSKLIVPKERVQEAAHHIFEHVHRRAPASGLHTDLVLELYPLDFERGWRTAAGEPIDIVHLSFNLLVKFRWIFRTIDPVLIKLELP